MHWIAIPKKDAADQFRANYGPILDCFRVH